MKYLSWNHAHETILTGHPFFTLGKDEPTVEGFELPRLIALQ
jgi:hypothetical protein